MTAPKSILVTGAEGFVGRRLCAALAERWPEARRCAVVFDRGQAVAGWANRPADIRDPVAIEREVADARPDVIVHLAAQASAAEAAGAAQAAWRVNVVGALNLAVAAARLEEPPTVLFASSAEVYGASLLDGPATEETPLVPLNVYARTKAAAEAMFDDVLGKGRLIIARPFNHTGPGQDERFVIPAFAAQIARIEAGLQAPPIRVGNLEARIDFLDVRDVLDAYVRLIAARGALPARSVFNIATGAPIAVEAALRTLLARSSSSIAIEVDAARARRLDVPCSSGSPARLHAATGWAPVHGFEDTLGAVLEHHRRLIAASKESS